MKISIPFNKADVSNRSVMVRLARQVALISSAVMFSIVMVIPTASAELVEEDLFNLGDGLITRDTQTGLRWLDVTETQGLSVDFILGDGDGWLTAGYRYATLAEVQTLAQNAGVVTFSPVNIRLEANVPGVSLLIDLLGNVGTTSLDVDATRGVAANDENDPPFENISFANFLLDNQAHAIHQPFAGSTAIPNIFVGHFLVQGKVEVSIDIKPASDPNSINLCNQGNVTVAILTTPNFDATTVDPETATLADVDVRTVGKSDKMMAHIEDVDGDGDLDLVLQFETVDLALSPGSLNTVATVKAETFDGQAVTGTDDIEIVKDC